VIGPVVARFSAEYPEIGLDISVEVEQRDIVGERFDAGIHTGESIAQDMIAVPIGGQFRFSTVASLDYLARKSVPMSPGDLQQHNCVRYRGAADSDVQTWKFCKADQVLDVEVNGTLTVNDPASHCERQSTAWDRAAARDVRSVPGRGGRLVRLLSDWSPRRTEFSLFYSSRRHLPLKLRALVDFLRKQSKSGTPANEGRPICLPVVAAADGQRSESSAGGARAAMANCRAPARLFRSVAAPRRCPGQCFRAGAGRLRKIRTGAASKGRRAMKTSTQHQKPRLYLVPRIGWSRALHRDRSADPAGGRRESSDQEARVIAVVPDALDAHAANSQSEPGLGEGWVLADQVRDLIAADRGGAKRPIISVVDAGSQAHGRMEDLLGISSSCAAAADAYAAARRAGHPLIGLLVGSPASGAFLAHGFQAIGYWLLTAPQRRHAPGTV